MMERRIETTSHLWKAITWLVLGTTMTACERSSGDLQGLKVSETDSAGLVVVSISGRLEDLPLWTVSEEPIFEVNGDSPPFLGRIGEVAFLGHNGLLVEDDLTHELRLFDSANGNVRLIGGAGDGPGEFQNLTEVSVASGEKAITFDRRLNRISVFDSSGTLASTVQVSREDGGRGTIAMGGWLLDSEHYLLHRLGLWDTANAEPLPRRDQRDAVLVRLGGDGVASGSSVRFRGGYTVELEAGDAASPFSNRPFILVGDRKVIFGSGLEYELTVSDVDLDPQRVIRWEGWRMPLSGEVLQATIDSLEGQWAEIREARPDIVDPLFEALFSPKILPDTLPAIGGGLLDETEQIWVAKFKPTTEMWDETDSWHVLDQFGHPIARVRLPEGTRLAACRSDRVVLISRDSLDVQSLRVHRLIDPTRAGQ